MTTDVPPPSLGTIEPEHRSRSSPLVRAAGAVSAAILMLVLALQIYWAITDAGPDFQPLLPPLAVAAWTITWTLGAAALLLTRIGVLVLPLPRWLVRVAPWLLAAFFALLALVHLHALATNPSGDWQIDLQGPLLLLLAGLCIIVASEEPPT
jgi:hypothetical protein